MFIIICLYQTNVESTPLIHKVKQCNLLYEGGALNFCSMKTNNYDQLLFSIIHRWSCAIWHCYWLQEKSSLRRWRAVMICLSVLDCVWNVISSFGETDESI